MLHLGEKFEGEDYKRILRGRYMGFVQRVMSESGELVGKDATSAFRIGERWIRKIGISLARVAPLLEFPRLPFRRF